MCSIVYYFFAVVLKLILKHHDILHVLISATEILVSTTLVASEPCFLTNETFALCLV